MQKLYTLLLSCLLTGTHTIQAQLPNLAISCFEADTVACLAAVPAPNPALIVATSSCPLDLQGNPINPNPNGGSGTGAPDSCAFASDGCYRARVVGTETLADGATRYSIRVDYLDLAGCKHDISHIAFGLPSGARATDFARADTYRGRLMSYAVENTTNNPYYSIKFNATQGGFGLGTYDVFVFTLPAGVSYDGANIPVRIKAGRILNNLDLSTACVGGSGGPVTPDTSSVVNVEVTWIFDYVLPGGTGCYDDPITIRRSYTATDGCYNTDFCAQLIVVSGPCVGGAPQACSIDSSGGMAPRQTSLAIEASLEYNPEQDQYGVTFEAYNESKPGRYRISKIARNPGTESFGDAVLLGLVAFQGDHSYSFAHELISSGDSILVEWEGPAELSGLRDRGASTFTSLRAYPNPGTNYVNLRFAAKTAPGDRLRILSMQGRTISEIVLEQGTQSQLGINTADWSDGVYLIELSRQGRTLERGRWVKSSR